MYGIRCIDLAIRFLSDEVVGMVVFLVLLLRGGRLSRGNGMGVLTYVYRWGWDNVVKVLRREDSAS